MAIDLRLSTVKFQVPDVVANAALQAVRDCNRYDHQNADLRQRLSQRHEVATEKVCLISGIDQAIYVLSATFGNQTHVFTPTYISYGDASSLGGHVTQHDSLLDEGDYQIDPRHYPDATLFFVASPGNPVGRVDSDTIIKLARNNPDAIVFVDEAYGDFVDWTMAGDVAQQPNLVVARSFSKGFALAGARIGYLIANENISQLFETESLYFNVSHVSAVIALTALNHEEFFQTQRDLIISSKAEFEDSLRSLQMPPFLSFLNTSLVRFDTAEEATSLRRHLETNDVLVSQGGWGSNLGLSDQYIRFATGNRSDMQLALQLMSSWPQM